MNKGTNIVHKTFIQVQLMSRFSFLIKVMFFPHFCLKIFIKLSKVKSYLFLYVISSNLFEYETFF